MKLLCHRGPDQQGVVTLDTAAGAPFLLGQTRLNIMDRSNVPVPVGYNDSYIAFNGEVYNWQDIRNELTAEGVEFRTRTDTEVVLHAYLRWGPACLQRFNGMFAIAVWHAGELFLARDRIGKKPLFYKQEEGELAFGSEVKVFRDLEYEPIPICESVEFYFDEMTPFRNVMSLKPGEYLCFNPQTREIKRHVWWTFPEYEGTHTNPKQAVDEFLALFQDACWLRLRADVPVTLFLSGGIDSSLIQAVLGIDITYTCQFAEYTETINEQKLVLEYAKEQGFAARIIAPGYQDLLEALPRLAYHIEMPVGSFSVFPIYSLARAARQAGFKVALSGEGADELFNGYYRDELLLREDRAVQKEMRGEYGYLAARYFGSPLERFCRVTSRNGTQGMMSSIGSFRHHWSNAPQVPFSYNIARVETTVLLQPLLAMADRMSMAHGLEIRNPFLDYRIISFSAKLAPELRFQQGRGKWVIREALRRLVGEDSGIVCRKVKHGLPMPFNIWLSGDTSFDRRAWNATLLRECLQQLGVRPNRPD